jgi:arylsulfatase A
MHRREFLVKSFSGGLLCACADLMRCSSVLDVSREKTNIILICTDDQGYGDVGIYGSERVKTPFLDRMASEGLYFRDFCVAASVCTPSRAALLTGRYPIRSGLYKFLLPGSDEGLNPDEITIARILKDNGYSTACIGKWHLGDKKQFLPLNHGFDCYFGLPYSNDMIPENSTEDFEFPELPLIEGNEIVELGPDQSQLTKRYTSYAIDFISEHKDRPFFIYLSHSMPHVPLYVSQEFEGKSGKGLYSDVILELDFSVGRILRYLKEQSLEKQTLVIFISDNGPWLVYGDHAGTAGGLRNGKATSFEGGFRVPCIMWWPGRIKAGSVSDQFITSLDIFPTLAALAGADIPENRVIDGKDISLLFDEPNSASPREVLYYYQGKELQAIRKGKWKMHLPHKYYQVKEPGHSGRHGKYEISNIKLSLFDLSQDIAETKDIAKQNPYVVAELLVMAENARADMGDALKNIKVEMKQPD